MYSSPTSNLDSWISEFPALRSIIVHPRRVQFFMANPCPTNNDETLEHEWNQVLLQLRE